jgi:hypothetical protein
MSQKLLGIVLLGTLAVGAAACSDSSGVNETGPVVVTLQRSAAPSLAIAAEGVVLDDMGKVTQDQVDSLFVMITSLQFLTVDSLCDGCDSTGMGGMDHDSTDCCGYWINLPLAESVVLDLMALPTADDSVFVIAGGDVPVGDYRKVRLVVGDAWVYFNTTISVGQQTYEADVEQHVTVPSGRLKTDAWFSVLDDGAGNPTDVNLVFDPDATFRNMAATGSGKINLAPVFKKR